MTLSNQLLYFNGVPTSTHPRKPIGGYSKSPLPARKKLTKPRGVYTKGTVRSNGTSTRKVNVSPVTSHSAPAKPTFNLPASATGGGGSSLGSSSGGAVSAAIAQLAGMGSAGALAGSTLSGLRRQATSDIGLELNPQISARQFAYNQARSARGDAINELRRQLGNRVTETNQLYSALDLTLAAMANKQKAAYETGRTQSNAAYDTLSGQIGTNYSNAKAQTTAELQRVGQAAAPATDRLTADQQFLTGQVGAQKAAASSTIDAIQTAAAGEQASLRGAAKATAPMLIAQARSAADQEKRKIEADWRQTSQQLKYEINQLEKSRRPKIEKLYNQYVSEAQQAAQDAAQLQFLNTLKVAELGISQGQLDLAKSKAASDAQTSQANLVLRSKELQLAIAKAKGKTPNPTGMEKAYTYLSSYKGKVPQAQLQQALDDAINGNSNDPGFNPKNSGQPGSIPGYSKQYLDIYMRDIDSAARSRGWSNTERLLLRNAALKYLGA